MNSTPKSERRVNPASRLKQLKDSEEVQRNLSTSWADIIEELEQQSKELTDYSDKVAEKYSLDKEKLKKSEKNKKSRTRYRPESFFFVEFPRLIKND